MVNGGAVAGFLSFVTGWVLSCLPDKKPAMLLYQAVTNFVHVLSWLAARRLAMYITVTTFALASCAWLGLSVLKRRTNGRSRKPMC